jgi:hypothetical protein
MAQPPTPYRWRDLRFACPAGLVDDTLVTLRDPQDPPRFHLTVTTDTAPGSVLAYAAEQERELKAEALAGYSAEGPTAVPGSAPPRVVVERRFTGADGAPFVQRQAFLQTAPGQVAVVTATAKAAASAAAFAAHDTIVTSLNRQPESP